MNIQGMASRPRPSRQQRRSSPGIWLNSYFGSPSEHRTRCRTVNAMERLNKEIARRTRVTTLFLNEESLLRPVTAVIDEDWATGKIYPTMKPQYPNRNRKDSRWKLQKKSWFIVFRSPVSKNFTNPLHMTMLKNQAVIPFVGSEPNIPPNSMSGNFTVPSWSAGGCALLYIPGDSQCIDMHGFLLSQGNMAHILLEIKIAASDPSRGAR